MKKILVSALFVAALLPSLAFGQAIKQGTTSSAGDAGSNIPLCRASAAAETINTEDKYGYLSCDLDGNVRTTGTTSLSWSGSTTDPSKLEDAAHVTGDRGMAMLGIADDNTPSPTSGTAGDYVLPAISSFTGALQVSVVQAFQSSAGAGLMNLEDTASANGDTGVPSLGVYRSTFSQSAGTAGDYTNQQFDGRGLLSTNPWGADSTEWFRACSGSDVTGTAATEVVAATASKYKYLTAVNCTNTDATVNTRVDIVENTSSPATIWMLNLPAITGSDGIQFNPPLKSTSVNQNLGVTPITTSAEVRCCMTGFVSAN